MKIKQRGKQVSVDILLDNETAYSSQNTQSCSASIGLRYLSFFTLTCYH